MCMAWPSGVSLVSGTAAMTPCFELCLCPCKSHRTQRNGDMVVIMTVSTTCIAKAVSNRNINGNGSDKPAGRRGNKTWLTDQGSPKHGMPEKVT